MKLTLSQATVVRHIQDLPQRSRITSGSAPSGCAELEAAGYVKIYR